MYFLRKNTVYKLRGSLIHLPTVDGTAAMTISATITAFGSNVVFNSKPFAFAGVGGKTTFNIL